MFATRKSAHWACAILFLFSISAVSAQQLPAPPTQPTTGPGGSEYPFGEMIEHSYGEGADHYWIFEPSDPTPKSAPVIVFCHGWGAISPNIYGAWIRHLVRRGNIVIYPQYQEVMFAPLLSYTAHCLSGEKAAMAELQTGKHVTPELDHVAVVGHSLGGAIAPNLAAVASSENLPVPKAICCVEPANHNNFMPAIEIPLVDDSKIPADTLVQIIVGDRDQVARQDTAQKIFYRLSQIPKTGKNYIMLISDDHGSPPLIGNHMAPVALETIDGSTENQSDLRERWKSRTANAMDFYGIWKLFDGLTDAAFYGKNKDYALGDTSEQRYMGKWSDGTPVKELKVIAQP